MAQQQGSNRNPSQNQTERNRGGVATALSTRDFSAKAVKFEEQFNRLIPTSIRQSQILTGKRIIGLLVNLWTTGPEEIQQCRPSTLLNAAGLACAVGLEFNNSLGQSAIIPWQNHGKYEAQWQPMYRGLITLASRSGRVHDVGAKVVLEQDLFEYELGTNEFLRHKPAPRWDNDFELLRDWRYVYSMVRFKDGPPAFHVMDRYDVDRIREQNSKASSNKAPWNTNPEEMIRKTPVKQHLKYLDLTNHTNMAVGADDQAESDQKQDVVLDWKDYSAEDVDNDRKTQVQGVGPGPRGSQASQQPPGSSDKGNSASGNGIPANGGDGTLFNDNTLSNNAVGPFAEDQFTADEMELLLANFKKNGHGTTKAQLVGFMGKWVESKLDLIEYLNAPAPKK
jgi:recombination protein RecT